MQYSAGTIGLVVGEVMPIYTYVCYEGHSFEIEREIIDDGPTECCFMITINSDEIEGKEGYGVPIKQKICGAPITFIGTR